MYLLEAPDESIPAFKDVWAGIGDSIVVVGGDGLWNCHIHTDDIGAAIEAAIDIGRPRKIRVTDLLEQVEEERWVREAADAAALDGVPEHLLAPVACAVVAVATGDGIRRIFHSLGVQGIVTGGQSMNPSTAELLDAVEARPADHVVILPNNKNIIPVAEQVDAQTDEDGARRAHQGHHRGVRRAGRLRPRGRRRRQRRGDGRGGRRASWPARSPRRCATRRCDAGPIAAGDWLGLGRTGILAVEAKLADAATVLLDVLVAEDHEIVTIIEGEGASGGRTPATSPSGWPSTVPTWWSRCTTAASRSTRTSSASSSEAAAGARRAPRDEAQRRGARAGEGARPDRHPSIFDLLTHYPRRYLDKTKQSSIRDARIDEQLWIFGRVCRSATVPGRGRGKARTELRISDGSGYLRITFFNQPWRARQFPEGSEAMFFGKVTDYRGQKQLANPEVDLLDEEDRLQITPIYPQSDKLRLYSKDFRGWEGESLRRAGDLVEPLPAAGCSTSTTSSIAPAPSGASTSPSPPASTRRPGAVWSSTSSCASSSRSSCASARSRPPARASSTTPPVSSSAGSWPACPSS